MRLRKKSHRDIFSRSAEVRAQAFIRFCILFCYSSNIWIKVFRNYKDKFFDLTFKLFSINVNLHQIGKGISI